jgi:hypothetical protein
VNLEELIRRSPKPLVAFIVLTLGLVFMVLFNPPRTACDKQFDYFVESQVGFLTPEKGSKKVKPIFGQVFANCKEGNSPGACFDLFLGVGKMLDELERFPRDCSSVVAGQSLVRQHLVASLDLMVKLAWGAEAVPTGFAGKHSWFDASDFRLFCRTKAMFTRLYGEDSLKAFREKLYTELPGASDMSREAIWSRSILSSNCQPGSI